MAKKFKKTLPNEEQDAYTKLNRWFFDYPTTEFGLNDLCSALKISKTTANKVVTLLKEENFLNVKPIGNLWRISCNPHHAHNLTRKIPYHLNLIYESGIIERIRETNPNPRAIILFGSYRKGDDIETSDIDVAVELLDDDEVQITELGIIPQLGYRQNVRVNAHMFSRNKINLNLFVNIANGIVLDGFLEVRP
jgi:predicted nucleotidyltransferase